MACPRQEEGDLQSCLGRGNSLGQEPACGGAGEGRPDSLGVQEAVSSGLIPGSSHIMEESLLHTDLDPILLKVGKSVNHVTL